ncbi:DUF190 domain-containing protein [Vulcanimicrobium alpinum]|uniref:DUF190 domain-containing protein n=1 Tax=Vulcanimicrobium alpinum TaxID=3016050 RepID=UPI00295E2F75|nr:DUF190 domain-containing protein [Vulcanimicrobium alpinum]
MQAIVTITRVSFFAIVVFSGGLRDAGKHEENGRGVRSEYGVYHRVGLVSTEAARVPLAGPAKLLRVVIGEADRAGHRPLYAALVECLKGAGIAGATVLRGVEGYGGHATVHAARILDLSSDLPMVVEAVDTPERIAAVLPAVRALVREGLVTLQDVEVVALSPSAPAP